MEATGGWSEELAFYLQERGHVVSIEIRCRFARLVKVNFSNEDDKADAGLIARFCQAMQPTAWNADTRGKTFAANGSAPRSLVEMRTQELNR